MKAVFIGCVEFSLTSLNQLLNIKEVSIVGVITKQKSDFNSDFCDLGLSIQNKNIPVFYSDKNNQEKMLKWIKELSPDVVFCLGWSYLLNEQILNTPRLGVIGYHPAALPKNRGRHPIIWALALGLQETASTFFKMDSGADTGDIASQVVVKITPEDNSRSLYNKLAEVSLTQLSEFVPKLANGNLKLQPQNHSVATSWRKRSQKDGLIDWRMSAETIHNLVRALTKPYVGASFEFNLKEFKVWNSKVSQLGQKNDEPGKILAIDKNSMIVKCGIGSIELVGFEYQENSLPKIGGYL